MNSKIQSPVDKWALFRFSVVGSLLANPPAKGELRKNWSGSPGRFTSTHHK